MAWLQYNGVTIDIGKTLLFEQRDVYTRDNTQYLYTHFHIRVQGIVNPLLPTTPGNPPTGPLPTVANARPTFDAGPVPARALGGALVSPSATINTIRNLLIQQRKTLIYATQDLNNPALFVTLLRSPRQIPVPVGSQPTQTFNVDSKNGPLPIGVPDIVEVSGDKTFLVAFEVETWINECGRNSLAGQGRIILAHRWEDNHEIDEDFYTTRTVRGTAIFDTAWLSNITNFTNGFGGTVTAAPDDFRSTFFHPIPFGFQRKNIQVTASEDGTSIDYSFNDVQTPYNLNSALNITRFSGTYSVGVSMPGGLLAGTILQLAQDQAAGGAQAVAANALANAGIAGIPFLGGLANLFNGVNAAAGNNNGGAGAGLFPFLANLLPQRTVALECTVYGNPSTTRAQLLNAIRNVVGNYGLTGGPAANVPVGGLFATLSATITIFLAQRVAVYRQTATLNRLEAAVANTNNVNAAAQLLSVPAAFNSYQGFLFSDTINVTTGPGFTNPSPPNDSGTRGTSVVGTGGAIAALERCVAQALTNICVDPVAANTLTTQVIGQRTKSFDYTASFGA